MGGDIFMFFCASVIDLACKGRTYKTYPIWGENGRVFSGGYRLEDGFDPRVLVLKEVLLGNSKGWGNPRGTRGRVRAGPGTGQDSATRQL